MSQEEKYRKLYKRLTVTELRKIVEFYHAQFPNWKVIDKGTLVREDGPVAQGIVFERLSAGDYRPTGHVRVLVAPEDAWALELSQRLSIKLRQISRGQDTPEFRGCVVQAIRAEFVPSVEAPLVAEDVLALYEKQALPTDAEAYSLAPLNAYFGREERAIYWCDVFRRLLENRGEYALQDFNKKRQTFLNQLEQWLHAGEAKAQLERVLQDERRQWGLAY